MTNDTAERTWTQAPSGDWLTDGAHGRRYRYHPLSGLHCFDPMIGFEYGVPMANSLNSDMLDADVARHEAEKRNR
jgi:hypothetical protein